MVLFQQNCIARKSFRFIDRHRREAKIIDTTLVICGVCCMPLIFRQSFDAPNWTGKVTSNRREIVRCGHTRAHKFRNRISSPEWYWKVLIRAMGHWQARWNGLFDISAKTIHIRRAPEASSGALAPEICDVISVRSTLRQTLGNALNLRSRQPEDKPTSKIYSLRGRARVYLIALSTALFQTINCNIKCILHIRQTIYVGRILCGHRHRTSCIDNVI